MEDFELELKKGFLEEIAQSITDVEQCFLDLESGSGNAETLNKIFRLAHNIKGGSKAVGFNELGAFTHTFESFILRVKNSELKATPKVVSLMLRVSDHVRQMIEAYSADLNAVVDCSELTNEMITFQDTSDSPSEEKIESTVEQVAAPQFEAPVLSQPIVIEESIPAELQQVSDEVAAIVTASIEAPKANASNGKSAVEESIRVALPRVENLIDYIGEMAILQNVLKEQLRTNESLIVKKTLSQLGKVSKEIQDLAMSLRMIPLKPTFQKMQRIVRDTAQALKKDVGITLQGEDTELDKTVLERINDPLVHLIRNAVDHGIESAEVRVAKNKAAKGTVTLSAVHRAGRLVIEVKDDGGGLDPAKLVKKAIEKGILKAGTVLSDADAYQLIFAPGFSTKELVTDVSGRGVGMDVVRTNIQELGGEVQIESVLGAGTTFRIFLPLTLAIIDAMVVMLNSERYVMPLNHVHETLQPKPELIHTTINMGDVMVLRGDHLPVYRLGDFFGLRPTISIFEMTALVIRTTKEPFIVLVDSIIGQQQVVIKQLGAELSALKGVSGTTILGDGKPALILEPSELIKKKISRLPYQQGAAA